VQQVSHDSERGAAAVEFAILLPLLLMLVLGTIEFGRAYNAQITLTNAARDGVRVMAIGNDRQAPKRPQKARPLLSAQQLPPRTSQLAPPPAVPGAQVTLTIKYTCPPSPALQGLSR
jgi:Flp pilus assembly pilin Flp